MQLGKVFPKRNGALPRELKLKLLGHPTVFIYLFYFKTSTFPVFKS